MKKDVIIVGGGPAGIFAALTLADLGISKIVLLEKGKDIGERNRLDAADMLCGWGGAGASPAAEHIGCIEAVSLPDVLPLFKEDDLRDAEIGQGEGGEDACRTPAHDDDVFFHSVPPLEGYSMQGLYKLGVSRLSRVSRSSR